MKIKGVRWEEETTGLNTSLEHPDIVVKSLRNIFSMNLTCHVMDKSRKHKQFHSLTLD